MSEYGAADLNLGITEKLAGYLADLQFEDLPDDVIHECRRGILDWLGCALAGSEHSTLDTLTGGAASSAAGTTVTCGSLATPRVGGLTQPTTRSVRRPARSCRSTRSASPPTS